MEGEGVTWQRPSSLLGKGRERRVAGSSGGFPHPNPLPQGERGFSLTYSATRTSIFPKFPPLSTCASASGAFSRPFTTVSR